MPPPANWTGVDVTGTYITPDGVAATGTVTFTTTLYLRDPVLNFIIVPKPVQATLNGSGTFSTTLQATNDPDIVPEFFYTVTESINSVTTSFQLLLPDGGGPVDLADVDRNLALTPTPTSYVRTWNGLSGDVTFIPAAPAGSVVAETSYAQATVTGVSLLYARQDHTHGTVALATATPTAITISGAAAPGSGTTPSKNDHAHAGPGFAAVVAETTFGLAAATGVAVTVPHSDHAHGTPTAPTAASIGAIASSNGVPSITAAATGAMPAAGTATRLFYDTTRRTLYSDNGAAWVQADGAPAYPNSWVFVGHSYLMGSFGAYDQRARLDNVIRTALDVEPANSWNLAVAGSRWTVEGASTGGWATFGREIRKQPGKTGPYTSADGGLIMLTGINDLGSLGGATTQMQAAWGFALEYGISKWRASVIFKDTDASVAYGGTWTAETGKHDQASYPGTWRYHATTAGTVTITLPADYNGEPVALCLVGRFGALGGTVTFSGTALTFNAANGTTLVTNNVMPTASLSNIGMIKRITGLTSANAGQTIIITVTANVGLVYFDSWWLEDKNPPPVIVCNIPKLPAAGYSGSYPAWNAAPALGSCNNDVDAFNAVIATVVAGFDGMVKIADANAALNQVTANYSDNLHPNDIGAALIADAIDDARRQLTLTSTSRAMNMSMASRYAGGGRIRRFAANYYTADYSVQGGAYTLVAGDMFAIPYEVTEPNELYQRWAFEVAAAGTGSPTIRWGMFADFTGTGCPDTNLQELTYAGAFTITAGTGVKLNPAAQFNWRPDVALYWLVFKIETIGTPTWTLATIQGPSKDMPNIGVTGAVSTGARSVGWKVTGQAAGALPSTFPTATRALTATAPVMSCLKT